MGLKNFSSRRAILRKEALGLTSSGIEPNLDRRQHIFDMSQGARLRQNTLLGESICNFVKMADISRIFCIVLPFLFAVCLIISKTYPARK